MIAPFSSIITRKFFLNQTATLLFFLFFAPLVSKGQEPRLVLPAGHNGTITSFSFSPDNSKLVTGSNDYTLKVWEVRSGALLLDLQHHKAAISSAKYSPDGKYIVSTAADSTAVIWDAMAGTPAAVLNGHSDLLYSSVFNAKGDQLATLSADQTIKLWTVPDGKLLFTIKAPSGVNRYHFSADGKLFTIETDSLQKINYSLANGEMAEATPVPGIGMDVYTLNASRTKLAAVADDNSIIVWDFNSGKQLLSLKGHKDFVPSLVFSPDGKRLISASEDQTTKLWNVETGLLIATYKGQGTALMFSQDSRKVIAYFDKVRVYNAIDGKIISTLNNFRQDQVLSAAFDHTGSRLALSAKFEETAGIWNVNTGRQIASLTGRAAHTTFAAYSADGKYIKTGGAGEYLWDAQSGQLLNKTSASENFSNTAISPDGSLQYKKTGARISIIGKAGSAVELKGNFPGFNRLYFTPDNKKVVVVAKDSLVTVWSAATGSLIRALKNHPEISLLSIHDDGRTAVIFNRNGQGALWDLEEGTLIAQLPVSQGMVYDAVFSHKKLEFITRKFQDDTVYVWDAGNGRIKAKLDNKDWVNAMAYSPDGNFIAVATDNHKTRLWNAETYTLTHLESHSDRILDVVFNAARDKVLTASADKTAVLANTDKTAQVRFAGHSGKLWTARLSPDEQRVVTTSVDNTIRVWKAGDGKLLYTFFALDSINYFVQVPGGYYMATPKAAKALHYVTKDLKIITFEQLDVKYNRPDKVLEAIGSPDTALINSYKKAYEKRIKKLNIDTSSFKSGYSVPEADFMHRDKVPAVAKQPLYALRITGRDASYMLDRFNVWVNEVPVFGMLGLSLRSKNTQSLDTTIMIRLSDGENRIEASVINTNGTESYRMPLYISYTPAVKRPQKIYFAGIGINRFMQPENNLTWSVKDIRDLATRLKLKYGENFILVDTLFDKRVTVKNVSRLKEQLARSTVNDKVIIAYSGHGLLSSDFDYYLSTYGIDFKNPGKEGLPYENIEALTDRIPARQKLLLIDACHSGEVDKEELAKLTLIAAEKKNPGVVQSRGVELVPAEGSMVKLGMKNSFELMRSIFVNVGKSTGATIISAAGGMQYALETSTLRNGVFTYSILETLQKFPSMYVSQLSGIVAKRVEELTRGAQKPTSRNENISVDWRVW